MKQPGKKEFGAAQPKCARCACPGSIDARVSEMPRESFSEVFHATAVYEERRMSSSVGRIGSDTVVGSQRVVAARTLGR